MHLQRHNTQSDQGFTLLEVAFVVLLMSILLMIALATFHTTTESANAAACRSNQDALTKAVLIAATAGNPPDAIGDLEPYIDDYDTASLCPEDGTPLQFDATTNTVTCPNHDQ